MEQHKEVITLRVQRVVTRREIGTLVRMGYDLESSIFPLNCGYKGVRSYK